MDFSTGTTAALLSEGLTTKDGDVPNFTAAKIGALIKVNKLTDKSSPDGRMKVDIKEALNLLENSFYLPEKDYAKLGNLIYRVSCIPTRENRVYDMDGELIREYAGLDFDPSIPEDDFLSGFEGAWSVSEANANLLVEHSGLLIASVKGYIDRSCVRRIVDWFPIKGSPRKFFYTEPIKPGEIPLLDGKQGFFVDIPGGSESGLLHKDLDAKK